MFEKSVMWILQRQYYVKKEDFLQTLHYSKNGTLQSGGFLLGLKNEQNIC
jgi:hypothetical protein